MIFIRVAVEYNYKDLKKYWNIQDYARNLKVIKSPIGNNYNSCTILLNLHAYLYQGGNI